MNTLVLDIGSSSARALLFDDRLTVLAETSASYQFSTTPHGASEIDADFLRQMTERCIDEILRHPAAENIGVVGLTSFGGNLLGMDAQGRALTPIYTYADTRSADDVEYLRRLIDPAETHHRTGVVHHTAYWPGRIAWIERTHPTVYQQAATWLDFGAYLMRHWFGQAISSYSAAAWNGVLNRGKLTWDDTWLEILELDRAHLPELADYDRLRVGLMPDYAMRWPALQNIPFTLTIGDGAAANIGVGAIGQNRLALTIGTTAALRIVINQTEQIPPVPAGLWSYRVNSPHHLIGGATSEGGNIFQWARETLKLDPAMLETDLRSREADAHGLTFLPLLNGERSPGWWANATGGVIGLHLSTTPLDIVQAALEGVAIRLSLIADQLKPLIYTDAEVIGGGGALVASPTWAQMICNALNRPLHLTAEKEVTARGMAILARAALGIGTLEDFPPTITHTLLPQPEAVQRLHVARERQVALYHYLKGTSA